MFQKRILRVYPNFNLICDYLLKHLHSQTTNMPECTVRQKKKKHLTNHMHEIYTQTAE